MSETYDFKAIERKWLERWQAAGAWDTQRLPTREKRYVLEMFPYPSGDMHMGHVENYTIGDAIARFWTMRGYDVLHPMGFDSFGLPAENAALQRGVHPREWTYQNIETFFASCVRLGFTYDRGRVFRTSDPDYYRWNQWLFLRFFERGLAYRKAAKVNWCPSCKTVLANEQISSGVCWRCGSVPEPRDLEQWFFKTTGYAQRLLDDMDQLRWPDNVLTMQRNWIGRSDGAVVRFSVEGHDVEIFTTRPDTLYGVTFFVFAPEHPIARGLAARAGRTAEYETFLEDVRRTTEIDRSALGARRKAFDLRAEAVNPLNGERVPVYAADYVLMEYGTGAIMAVPAHDQRDFEFARQLGLPVRVVIQPPDEPDIDPDAMTEAVEHHGVMVNSGPFDGTPADDAIAAVVKHLEAEGIGRGEIHYRLRDWLLSRQRYWGTPIPIIHCDVCGLVPVPDDQLPVVLPDDAPLLGEEGSPLANVPSFVNVDCPGCGGAARRDTDTMDTFVDSSWYPVRFCDPRNEELPFDPNVANAWMPVDQYIGGAEHAVMHLIYARFFTKVLHDMGMLDCTEPFIRLLNNGKLLMGGKMMSKSLGNVVEPGEVLELFGADAARTFILFIGPPDADYDWPDTGAREVTGAHRFLERVWRLVTDNAEAIRTAGAPSGDAELRRTTHRKLAAITADYDRYSFNTAIARMMELQNALSADVRGTDPDAAALREGVEVLLHALAPIAPYITEELWERIGGEGSIHARGWPDPDPALAREESVTMVVQVDGKVRDRIEVSPDISEQDAVAAALASEKVRAHLNGGEPAKVIARPPRLVNVLTR